MTAGEANRLLESLIDAIEDHTTLSWALQHGEKLSTAWSSANHDTIMRDVLYNIMALPFDLRLCSLDCDSSYCQRCVAMVRAAFPTLTMLDVMRALEAHCE